MTEPNVWSLFAQLPLVGIFFLITVYLQRAAGDREKTRDEARALREKVQDEARVKREEVRDETWTKTLDRLDKGHKDFFDQLMTNFSSQGDMWRQSFQEISIDVKGMKSSIGKQNAVLTALVVKASDGDEDSMNKLIEVLTNNG